MTDMREAARAAYLEAYAKVPTIAAMLPDGTPNAHWAGLDAVISLMQPEIDRRVAEERAKLLERLREPSEAMIDAGGDYLADNGASASSTGVWQAMLAQYEKEQQP